MTRTDITTAEGRTLALLYALPGAVAGILCWLASDGGGVAAERAQIALCIAFVYGTGAWALATEAGERRRTALFAIALGAALGLLAFMAHDRFGERSGVQLVLAPPALGWVALSFFRAGARNYARLFAAAWNLPLVLAVALAFAGLAYGLLWLLAAMFDLIGLPLLTEALAETAFSFPVIGALTASGIAVVRRQESVLQSLRTVLFGLLRVLAPVFALGTVLFGVALAFQGLDALWDGWSPVALLVSTLAAGAVFINAIVQDGDAPSPFLAAAARVQALVLPLLAGLAAYGMVVRIGAHGLTPARIVASLVALFAAAYALSYAVSGATGRWGVLRRANVWLALAASAVLAFTMTPLFRAQEWSVANQLSRLERGAVTPATFDYAAFAFDFGAPGRAALEALSGRGGVVGERAAAALTAPNRYALTDPNAPPAEAPAEDIAAGLAEERFFVRPEEAALPEDFLAAYGGRSSRDGARTAFLWLDDWAGPGEAILVADLRGGRIVFELWQRTPSDAPGYLPDWVIASSLVRDFGSAEAAEDYHTGLRNAPFGAAVTPVLAPVVDGEPLLPAGVRPTP